MIDTHHTNEKTDGHPSQIGGARRTRRNIRFSDPEWKLVEKAAEKRGITPSELVRNAALGIVDSVSQADMNGLSPELIEIIKRTHRGVYFLSTLKRDEMVHAGRGEEMDHLVNEAREAQAALLSSE